MPGQQGDGAARGRKLTLGFPICQRVFPGDDHFLYLLAFLLLQLVVALLLRWIQF